MFLWLMIGFVKHLVAGQTSHNKFHNKKIHHLYDKLSVAHTKLQHKFDVGLVWAILKWSAKRVYF